MPRTPHNPRKTMLCEGLVVQLGTPDATAEDALRMARRLVRRSTALKGGWKVSSLGPGCCDVLISPSTKSGYISVSRGWDLAADLRGEPEVADVEPALVLPGAEPALRQVHVPSRPSPASSRSAEPLPCSNQSDWSLALCQVQAAWGLAPRPGGSRFGEGVVIGHPDTGYTRHPEFNDPARLLIGRGYDFEDDKKDPRDALRGSTPSHGTSTGSVIMSSHVTPENVVSGAAPRAQLVPLRVSTGVVHLSFTKLTAAIRYASSDGHHVVSMSLGGPFYSRYLHRAIDDAVVQGVVLLAAAGNVWPWVVYPARYDEVVAVAACNCRGQIWSDSATGSAVDVSAPGESVWRARTRTNNTCDTLRGSGTSYAVATAAGICALWLAYHGRDNLIARYGRANLATIFKQVLIEQGVDVPAGWVTSKHGAGILNAKNLLQASLPRTPRAGGLRALHASAVPDRQNRIDVLMEYFPDADEGAVRQAIGKFLGVSTDEINIALAEHGDELVFHVATNPAFRAMFLDASRQRRSTRASIRRTLAPDTVFQRSSSRALRKRLSSH